MGTITLKLIDIIDRPNYLFIWIILIVAGFIIYSNTFNAEFQFDDGIHILAKDEIKNHNLFQEFSYWTNIEKRPLAKFTLALNYSIHQNNVTGYHLINIIIHILTSGFIFLLLIEIFKSPSILNRKLIENHSAIAFFCALLFLVHPIQTQSVTYIIQRMTALSGMFYVLSIYFYLKGRYSYIEQNRKQLIWLILAFLSGIAGILSKQSAVTFPVAWLLVELFFIRNRENKAYKKYLIICSSLLILLIVAIIVFWKLPKETLEISRFEYLATQFRVIPKYIQLSLMPVSQNLDYDFTISKGLTGIREILSLIFIIGIILTGVVLFRKQRIISFGIFFFLLSLSVESSIIPIQDVIFEHRLYLPILGIIIILVYTIFNLIKSKPGSIIICLALALIFASLTFARNETWKTSYSLWKNTSEKSPGKARPNFNFGLASAEKGDYQGALALFTRTIEIENDHMLAYFNRGNIRMRTKDYEGAVEDLRIYINNNPDHTEAYDILGKSLWHAGDLKSAITAFSKAIQNNPHYEQAYLNRAHVKLLMNDYNGAILDFKEAIKLNKTNPDPINSIGQTYVYLNKKEKALEYFTRAIEVDPSYAIAYFNRAYLYTGLKNLENGIKDFTKAIELDPAIILAYKGRGLIFYWQGRYKLAYNDLIHAQRSGADIPADLLQEIESKLFETN